MTYPNTFRIDIRFFPNDKGSPVGKLSDAELHFHGGPLDGLKLVGFSVWERRTGSGLNVTFPARQYSVNGERRSFALLRPIMDMTGQERIRDLIIDAWREHAAALDTIATLSAQPLAPPAPSPAIDFAALPGIVADPRPAIDADANAAAILAQIMAPEPERTQAEPEQPAPLPAPTAAPLRTYDTIQTVRAEVSRGRLTGNPPPFQLFA